jgi:hypothetical protein
MIEHAIALWSCPRSRSTVLARSLEQRGDCLVISGAFYPAYLKQAGFNHPDRDVVLRTQDCDPESIAARLRRPLAPDLRFALHKHIAPTILPAFGRSWFPARSVFLLRAPREIVLSLSRVLGDDGLSPADIGLASLHRLLIEVCELNSTAALVIHAADLAAMPRPVLERVCAHVSVDFDEAMMRWPAGFAGSQILDSHQRAPTDHPWHKTVARSTHFEPSREPEDVPDHLQWIVDECEPTYQRLLRHCVRFSGLNDASGSACHAAHDVPSSVNCSC